LYLYGRSKLLPYKSYSLNNLSSKFYSRIFVGC